MTLLVTTSHQFLFLGEMPNLVFFKIRWIYAFFYCDVELERKSIWLVWFRRIKPSISTSSTNLKYWQAIKDRLIICQKYKNKRQTDYFKYFLKTFCQSLLDEKYYSCWRNYFCQIVKCKKQFKKNKLLINFFAFELLNAKKPHTTSAIYFKTNYSNVFLKDRVNDSTTKHFCSQPATDAEVESQQPLAVSDCRQAGRGGNELMFARHIKN